VQETVAIEPELPINDIDVIQALVLGGQGVALLPIYRCRLDCGEDTFVRVLPQWQAKTDPISLVYPRQRFVPKRVRVFLDLAKRELSRRLD